MPAAGRDGVRKALLGNECLPNRCSCPSVRAVNRWNLLSVQRLGDLLQRHPGGPRGRRCADARRDPGRTGRSIEGATRSAAGWRVAPTGHGPLGLRLGLHARPRRVAARVAVAPVRQEVGHCRSFLRWRDPDSNRGHHDFQGAAADAAPARNACKSVALASRCAAALLAGLALLRVDLGLRQAGGVPNVGGRPPASQRPVAS